MANPYTLAFAAAMANSANVDGGRRTTAGGRLDCNETGDEDLKAARPLCFVLMPFGRKTDAAGRTTDFDAVYREIIAPAVNAGRARSDPRRRGEDRRRHPQADVRAADALQLRGRRHHRRQSQRLLRARHPPRDAAALDRDPVRGGHDPAVRHRAAARHSLPDQRAGRAVQSGRLRRARSPSSSARRRKTRTTTARCSSSSTTCRATRSTTPRPTRSATASTIRSSSRTGWPTRCSRASRR